jgi:RNA polymerase sigma-70 factor (ECF subfamily)
MELRATALWTSRIDPNDQEATELSVLLKKAIAGDVSAFEQIVVQHERRVLTLAWRLLGTMEDAQDAAQEVFLRAFKYLPRFDTRRKFEPWLVRIAVNTCRELGRKKNRHQAVMIKPEELPAPGDPHSEFSAEEDRRILYAAVRELPEKEKAALILRDIDGFSTADVAEILQSSESTVRSQVSSARVKIRKAIDRMKRGRK